MIDLTSKESPVRVAISEKHARLVLNRPDCLIVLCLHCGGAKSVTLHGSAEQIPPLFECLCEKPVLLPQQEHAHDAPA